MINVIVQSRLEVTFTVADSEEEVGEMVVGESKEQGEFRDICAGIRLAQEKLRRAGRYWLARPKSEYTGRQFPHTHVIVRDQCSSTWLASALGAHVGLSLASFFQVVLVNRGPTCRHTRPPFLGPVTTRDQHGHGGRFGRWSRSFR